MSRSPTLPATRLVKVRGERRWTAVPAYALRSSTPKEIVRLFHEIEHEMARSADPAADQGTRTRAAADAALRLSTVVLRASGYETHPPGDPVSTFEALEVLFGPEGRTLAAYFLTSYRRSRRKSGSGTAGTREKRLTELMREVERFRESILEWLQATRRNLFPARPGREGGLRGHQKTLF
jgi:hypothetical protein